MGTPVQAPKRPFEPYCRVCHRRLRRQSQTPTEVPGSVSSGVSGLCNRDYVLVRKGEIQLPGMEWVPPLPAPEASEFTWRSDLTPDELAVLVQVHARFGTDRAALDDLAGAFGFRTRSGEGGTESVGYVGNI